MAENINIQGYLNMINAPWGQLFYKLVWNNLNIEGKRILDFGSGFGVTADYLAKNNVVTAIEPNEDMLTHRICNNNYEQIVGGIEQLSKIQDKSFDVIVCHNVFEYVDNREEILREFHRLLKDNGILSIVKHNKAGKIMQKAVFEYNVEEALDLINNENIVSANFGTINEYENSELERYIDGYFEIEKVYGVRMLFGLQRNELKMEPDWISNMFKLECAIEENPTFRDIAFFQHIIIRRC